ncbi:hypothetical protein FF38_05526 [Lucilia cuprina]|uniref:Uncharacterized protein n=1 Tax=Lucilia cuprina TaxID=7375 RepID=A0A0L0CCA3_LUCCU|nr:hypothetical protein FF38_05526 [Lucilia cuprina]
MSTPSKFRSSILLSSTTYLAYLPDAFLKQIASDFVALIFIPHFYTLRHFSGEDERQQSSMHELATHRGRISCSHLRKELP